MTNEPGVAGPAPLAALIIPCHDEAAYLGAVLDAVLGQIDCVGRAPVAGVPGR